MIKVSGDNNTKHFYTNSKSSQYPFLFVVSYIHKEKNMASSLNPMVCVTPLGQLALYFQALVPGEPTVRSGNRTNLLTVREIVPEQYGLPRRHSLNEVYPRMAVHWYVLEIDPRYVTVHDGVPGLYFNLYGNHAMGRAAVIPCMNGYNGLEPVAWHTEAQQTVYSTWWLEQRKAEKEEGFPWWQNHWVFQEDGPLGLYHNLDSFFGIPVSANGMFDSKTGRVNQFALVGEKFAQLAGLASQVVDPEVATDVLSFMLWHPNERERQDWEFQEDLQAQGGMSPYTFKSSVLREPRRTEGAQPTIGHDFVFAVGEERPGYFAYNRLGLAGWERQPSALCIVIPQLVQSTQSLVIPDRVQIGGVNGWSMGSKRLSPLKEDNIDRILELFKPE